MCFVSGRSQIMGEEAGARGGAGDPDAGAGAYPEGAGRERGPSVRHAGGGGTTGGCSGPGHHRKTPAGESQKFRGLAGGRRRRRWRRKLAGIEGESTFFSCVVPFHFRTSTATYSSRLTFVSLEIDLFLTGDSLDGFQKRVTEPGSFIVADMQTNMILNGLIFQHELKEVEEKFRKAMIANAQLDNDKTSQTYQLELLKDR